MSALLEIQAFRIERGGRVRLEVPELRLQAGERLVLMGPNGAGKSTLLRSLALVEGPWKGDLSAFGKTIRSEGQAVAARRRMGVALQESLLTRRPVREEVALGLRFRGIEAQKSRALAQSALEQLGLSHLAERSSRGLSGGEARRVSLARAFAVQPEVLLLDEPFRALDPEARGRLLTDLLEALRKRSCALVLATHERDEALSIGGRLAVLVDGRIRQQGPMAEVFARPADAAVASLLGVENLLDAEVVEAREGMTVLRAGPIQLLSAGEGQGPGSAVTVCIRAEEILLARGTETAALSARNQIKARVLALEARGHRVRVELDAGVPLVTFVTRAAAELLELADGSEVQVMFKASAVHLFGRVS